QLLELGADLFASHSYDELSMARIAREAGISKALLYHYFPSKRELFVATLQQSASEVESLTEPDPELPPLEALSVSLDAFLGWIEEHPVAYGKLMESSHQSEVRDLVSDIRDRTSQRILDGVAPDGAPPKLRAAVTGWLWLMDGVILDWLQHHDVPRTELRDLLLGALAGVVMASGEGQALGG
ncbi:MAG: TetR/AcrR family transcriptional regulator, partial [Actinomycetota bacterium]|nr:TetR/AcrR family transcriptional regulator [Actinomycetota bacterium]